MPSASIARTGRPARTGRDAGLLGRARQEVAARCHYDQVGCCRGDAGTARQDGRLTRVRCDRRSSGRGHQVGHSVPCNEGRVHPLDHRHLRARLVLDPGRFGGQPVAEAADQSTGPAGYPAAWPTVRIDSSTSASERGPGCVPARRRPGRAPDGGGGAAGGVRGRAVAPMEPACSYGQARQPRRDVHRRATPSEDVLLSVRSRHPAMLA